MYRRGDMYSTNSLTLFLNMHASDKLPPESGMMIEMTLTILKQTHGQHYKVSGRFVFAGKSGWGWSNFIALSTFKDLSRGYLVGSSCIVKADVTIIGSSNDG